MSLDEFMDAHRVIVKARLVPAIGSIFQPTGFPDLGAAEFQRPTGDGRVEDALLVESVQSMGNRFEAVGWDAEHCRPVTTLGHLPYLEVRDADGRFVTSSRLEPHRLAGAYIRHATLDGAAVSEWLVKQLGVTKETPIDWRSVYAAVFQLDPLCLIHGVFFSGKEWKDYGNPKVRRAITAVIEAHGVKPVVSGGIKRDDVSPTASEGKGAKEGYGFIPFGRTDYTAERIELAIAVDVEQIRGYGLGDDATELLLAVALWEIRKLLAQPLRLRSLCDLEVESVEVVRPGDCELPDLATLQRLIEDSKVTFELEGPRTVTRG